MPEKLRFISALILTFIGASIFYVLCSALFLPELDTQPPVFDPEKVAEADALRHPVFDYENPPVVHQTVDYSEGPAGAWYPKGEAPILAELVAEGKLPPVDERVGIEPAVIEGVDGIGNYGGTWIRAANTHQDVSIVRARYACANLVRWSPYGYPIVPHVAKSYEKLEGGKAFLFRLRKGMRWSDGQPFTADDVVYAWNYSAGDTEQKIFLRDLKYFRDKEGTLEKIDDYTVVFRFAEPHGIFIERLATSIGLPLTDSPAHYLRPFHPEIGDPEMIETRRKAMQLPSPEALYVELKKWDNPEHPRLWPWIYRTYRASPPYTFVRNPYYFAVDPEGNQLPYMDRILFQVMESDLVGVAAANGEFTMQARHLRFDQYTLLMSQRETNGYQVYHWNQGGGTAFTIHVNLNRKIEPGNPASKFKHELLNTKLFRQALSLAIDRKAIIDTEFTGQVEPAQVSPSPGSPFFEPSLYQAYTQHDPERANALLDSIGLTRRDSEGFRTFRDGSRMHFYLNYFMLGGINAAMVQSVAEDWEKVGVRTSARERSRNFFTVEREGLLHDFTVGGSNAQIVPLHNPRYYVPARGAYYAIAYMKWFLKGGLYGLPEANEQGVQEPPPGSEVRKAMEIYDKVLTTTDRKAQIEEFRKLLKMAAENVWSISISAAPNNLVVVKDGVRNVPRNLIDSWQFMSPANGAVETYFYDDPVDSPGAIAATKEAVLEPTLPSQVMEANAQAETGISFDPGKLILRLILITIALLLALAGFRYPFLGRRLLLMVPTLFIVSIVTFIIIQLPPGDYLTSHMAQLEQSGEMADAQMIEDLKVMFELDKPPVQRYLKWAGFQWFLTFEPEDQGLLQGNMGRSMEKIIPVNDLVGDRILLTMAIGFSTILFTWALALPIGIYSAARQYSLTDYVFTFIGFIGMCVPNFLLALLLMYFSSRFFGVNVTGLFSAEYAAQPEWTWGKFVDMLQHIWIPVVVLGAAGTATMIRVMRGNLLDELRKPYVITARAKGVRPLRLLLKYPVRIALNPFISNIGILFPQVISGGAIVALILSLPTVGPLMLHAFMNEDMYLAGSMLMVLSLLGVIGVLVSDLLLLALDPRIRLGKRSR